MDMFGRILMVEDDPQDVELTLTALAEYNLANEVVVAGDGEEALDYLYCRGKFQARTSENPAVLLLDLKLPNGGRTRGAAADQGGREAADDPGGGADLFPRERDMVASYKLGMNAYVVKPVNFHEFFNAIKELGVFWAVIHEPPPGSVRKRYSQFPNSSIRNL